MKECYKLQNCTVVNHNTNVDEPNDITVHMNTIKGWIWIKMCQTMDFTDESIDHHIKIGFQAIIWQTMTSSDTNNPQN